MNSSGNSMDVAALRVREVFASQRAAFEADPYPLADRRREKSRRLKGRSAVIRMCWPTP